MKSCDFCQDSGVIGINPNTEEMITCKCQTKGGDIIKSHTTTGKLVTTYKGKEYNLIIEGTFVSTREGHDADGNRSWPVTYCEDLMVRAIEGESPLPSMKEIEEHFTNNCDENDILWDKEDE